VLRLVPFGLASYQGLVAPLAERLRPRLGTPVEVLAARFDPAQAFDPTRGQYNSRLLLGQLLEDAPDRALGVTALDLFVPVLSFVFGEAQLGGRAAVVSLHRLRSETYGLRPDPALLFERLAKEAMHELGHTLGLVHCSGVDCVMRSSTYVEDVDQKSELYCDDCWAVAALPDREPGEPGESG
jgi:archaemetzincin